MTDTTTDNPPDPPADDVAEGSPAPEIGDPIGAPCLFCDTTITVVLGPNGPTSMVSHVAGQTPDQDNPDNLPACPGTNLPPLTGNRYLDTFRRDALDKAVINQRVADALRSNVLEMFADKRPLLLLLDEIARMIQTETVASRWRELARDDGLTEGVYDAVADVAAPPATAVNDAFIDRNTRIGTRRWLREVTDNIPGSVLGMLVDKIA